MVSTLMKSASYIALLFSIIISVAVDDTIAECGYSACNNGDESKLNVHIVPHTHDDVGWLKTVDQYFYGAHTEIQNAGVQYILDTVYDSLMKDKNRRFIYVEIAFFYRWWNQQNDEVKRNMKILVNEGRFEFILGGWCMNDEASTHYNAIIDQMSLGMRFLNDTFGICGRPRVAWQIDPFGHSREQASLFAQMGFDGLFFGRLDFADKSLREKEHRMEEVWRGSESISAPNADLLTGVNQNGYGPPTGFCFDELCRDPPIMDDPRLEDYNVDEKVKDFIDAARLQAKHFKTNHIMLTMGSDFQYSNANNWFKNLDKLIMHVNEVGDKNNISVFYSTPSCYLYALNQANTTWTTKYDDFFPYADAPHNYWTGYFTSRAALKGYVRESNKILQACQQAEALLEPKILKQMRSTGQASKDMLQQAMGVAQHHDAVSGTEKQHVANDYAKRLYLGREQCKKVISTAVTGQPGAFKYCDYLNISICDTSETLDQFEVLVYNPLARAVDWFVRIPVNDDGGYFTVMDISTMKTIVSQLVPVSQSTMSVRRNKGSANSELVFGMSLPPIGLSQFAVTKSNYTSVENKRKFFRSSRSRATSSVTMQSADGTMSVDFDKNGRMSSITSAHTTTTIPLSQDILWYNASSGNAESQQASGAYIFRPNSSQPFPCTQSGVIEMEVLSGDMPLVREIYQKFSDWSWQVTRLYTGYNHIEVEWTIGPIPYKDEWGREVITRYNTGVNSDDSFYTDANGREMLLRRRDYRPTWTLKQSEPIAGNYYPVNSRIHINDSQSQFTILTDRSQGGASISSGSVELMLHRRLYHDDNRGVGEALNETGQFDDGLIVRGAHYLIVGNGTSTQKHSRLLSEQIYMSPLVTFRDVEHEKIKSYQQKITLKDSAMNRPLPENVHLLTLMKIDNDIIIRLEHQFQLTDDPELSKPATVSLKDLFAPFEPTSIEELSLAGNIGINKFDRLKWNGNGDFKPNPVEDFSITLKPMEIRTFRLGVRYN